MRRISLALLVGLFLPALAAGSSTDTKLTLVAYSTPKDAYGQLISAFQKTPAGNGVSFSQSYGASGSGKTPAQAVDYLGKLWKHVVAQPTSAREGLQTFLAGRGDVFLAYENEALFARQKGQPVQFVIPKATILIENPVAVTSTSKHKTEAKAFLKFLRTLDAQKIFAQNGYRPVVPAAARGFNFPVRPQLFTIKYVGGWAKVEKKFFDPQSGIMARFIASSGG